IINSSGEKIDLNMTSIPGIHIGSDESKNIVIRTFSGGGFAMGWISFILDMRHNGNTRGTTTITEPGVSQRLSAYPTWMQRVADKVTYDASHTNSNQTKSVWTEVKAAVNEKPYANNPSPFYDEPIKLTESASDPGGGGVVVFSFNRYNIGSSPLNNSLTFWGQIISS
ncbi:MAG: hypothetical protein ACFNOK_04385, partial [Aggregatibacter sp.]